MSTTNNHNSNTARTDTGMVIGAGYLGLRLAKRRQQQQPTVAVRRFFYVDLEHSPTTEQAFDGHWPELLKKVSPKEVFISWTAEQRTPEAYRATYVDGLREFLNACQELPNPPRVIAASSAAVWEQQDGQKIELSAGMPTPQKTNNQILREAEELILRYGEQTQRPCCNLRLSGLYGPQRTPGQRRLNSGKAITENPEGWINLIHVDDAVEAMMLASQHQLHGDHFVSAEAILRRELYENAHRELNTEPPSWSGESQHLGRRLDCQTFIKATGWKPQYGSIVDFLKSANSNP